MKVALVHDGLFCRGGGEKVLLLFQEAFPEAEIFTSIYDPNGTYDELKDSIIHTTWFNRIAKNEEEYKRRFFPLAIIAMRQLDLSDYDVVLMATTHCSKYVKFSKDASVFAYTFTPFRLAWNPESYSLYSDSKGLIKLALRMVVGLLKRIDRYYSKQIPNFIAMTEETKTRLEKAYHPKQAIPIVNPPINVSDYYVSEGSGDYYLVVSRLEKYKMVDLVVKAFNGNDRKLIVVGSGVEKERLMEMASDNVEFRQGVPYDELAQLYSDARGLIFPQHEDYGLTPLEAAASGCPVIGYGRGGILDTMVPFNGSNERESTALLFQDQTKSSLLEALDRFENLNFNKSFIRRHAEKFHKDKFIKQIQTLVLGELEG